MTKKKEGVAKSTNVKVIGVGGIGLCVLPTLCRYLNFNQAKFPTVQVSMIDGDTFEERNRDRQDFVEVGAKATMTAAEFRGKFPRIMFWDHPTYVTDANVIQLVREGDIVMLCVDNHKTRKLISDRAEELKNVTIISGGNDWTDGNVLIHIRRDGKNITLPLANKYHPEISIPRDKNPGDVEEKVAGCQVLAVADPQLLITNNLIAAMMLAGFYNVVEWKYAEKPEEYGEVYLDVSTMKSAPRPRKVS